MDYQVSARRYRPSTFGEVIGQPHIVQTLVNAISTKRIAHAFLFSGMRGVGKTTMARLLAKALNCQRGPTATPCNACLSCQEITQGVSVDVIEIDGASSTGVDDVRELRENVRFTPFHGSYRIYIIDEVHMLSNSAFNALLKTLEEPPPHAVFIFATTEVHKIPATILSRCQHYAFRRIPRREMIRRLDHIAHQDGIVVEERSLAAIARASDGSMRDALSLLDQAVAFGGKTIQYQEIERLLGAVPQEWVRAMLSAIIAQDSAAAITVIADLLEQGHDLRAYCGELVTQVRNLLVASVVSSPQQLQGLIDLSEDEVRQAVRDAKALTVEQLHELFRIFLQAEDALRSSSHPRFVLEVAAVRATRLLHAGSTSANVLQGTAGREGRVGRTEAVSPGGRAQEQKAAPVNASQAPAVRVDWAQLLDRVTKAHPNIGPFLELGTLVEITSNQVTIGFPKSASIALARVQKEEHLQVVTSICAEVAGQPIRLRLVEMTEGQEAQLGPARSTAMKEPDPKRALLERIGSHPFVKQTLDLFGGQVVDVRHVPVQKEVRG